jgi:hypothetical protein
MLRVHLFRNAFMWSLRVRFVQSHMLPPFVHEVLCEKYVWRPHHHSTLQHAMPGM